MERMLRCFKGCFQSKAGLYMHESWCKKLKQRNDTSKQTTNVSSTTNIGNETNKANADSESKIITEVIADLLNVFKLTCNVDNRKCRDKRKTYTNELKYQVILEASSDAYSVIRH